MVKNVNEFLRIGKIKGTLSVKQKQKLVKKTKFFTLKNSELYKMGQDNKLQ